MTLNYCSNKKVLTLQQNGIKQQGQQPHKNIVKQSRKERGACSASLILVVDVPIYKNRILQNILNTYVDIDHSKDFEDIGNESLDLLLKVE